MQFELISDPAALEALAADWRGLQERTHWANPFLAFEWTWPYFQNMCAGSTPFVLCAREDDGLAAVLPLRLERKGPARVLRFIGDPRSDLLDLLHEPGRTDVRAAVGAELESLKREWDVAFLRNVGETSELPTVFPTGVRSRTVAGDMSFHLPLDKPFDELKASGKQLKAATKRRSKFARQGGEVEHVTGADAAALVPTLVEIERASWKAQEGGTLQLHAEAAGFYSDVLAGFGERGQVWLARVEGEPVAFLINLVTPEKVWFYMGAYKASARKYFAGGVLHSYAIEKAADAGLGEYDFLNGDEAYKLEWCTGSRTLRNVAAHPRTARGYAAYATYIAPRWGLRNVRLAQKAVNTAKELRQRRTRSEPA